jgi:hypothetical protein
MVQVAEGSGVGGYASQVAVQWCQVNWLGYSVQSTGVFVLPYPAESASAFCKAAIPHVRVDSHRSVCMRERP